MITISKASYRCKPGLWEKISTAESVNTVSMLMLWHEKKVTIHNNVESELIVAMQKN